MRRALRWLMPAVALAVAACHRSGAPPSDDARPRAAEATAVNDEMCREHGVLEAVCVKCNPALIPVFKDKGDWCAEHGFPESFCPICHPERGGRPAADVGGEPPKAEDAIDGTRIRFKSDQSAELAGLETERVRAGSSDAGLGVPGTVVADPARLARVNARAAGVLREVLAEVGSSVKKGDVLAVVASPEAGAARSHVEAAEARVRATRAEQTRIQALLDAKIASERELVAARRDVEEAEAALASARAEAGPLGAIAAGGAYSLRAPLDGVVIERAASVGQLIHSEDALFTVLDPTRLWVELDIPEHHLAGVAPGGDVEIATGEGRHVVAKLESISPIIDPLTRTARARVSLPNADGMFRINARVRARLLAADPGGSTRTISASALQHVGTRDVVFVRRAPDVFELRRVEVDSRDGDLVTIRGGVEPGDEVATVGSFLLKTEILKASIGSGCCEVE